MASVAKDIQIGLVGSGMGTLLLGINQDSASRMKVAGICETDPARLHQRYHAGKGLSELSGEFGVDFITDSYQELLDRKDIGVIAIFTPCPLHFEQIKAALDAGKHLIVTKPMVTSMDQARQIVSLAESAGRKVLVAQSMRWNSMFLEIHRLFARGDLGKIKLAEAYYVHDMRTVLDRSPWRYEMPQDLIYGGVCHPADLLRWFLGEVDEVFAYGSHAGLEKRYPPDKETNFIISLKYRSGIIARILGAYDLVHPPGLWHKGHFHGVGIGLYGTKASLLNDRIVYDYYPEGKPEEKIVRPEGNEADHAGEILGCLRHFEDCIVNDKKPLVDVRSGAQIVAICSACWESIHTGAPVRVSREFD